MKNQRVRRILIATCGLFCVAACTDEYQAIAHSETRWTVEGTLVFAGSGKSIPNNKIEILRTQRDCRFCEIQGITLATTFSDSRGNFQIESHVPGVYELITSNPNNRICSGQAYLGHLTNQRKRVVVKVKENGCYLIM